MRSLFIILLVYSAVAQSAPDDAPPNPKSPATVIALSRPLGLHKSKPAMHALGLVGTPYRYGGESESTGVDCSAFVKMVYAKVGIQLPRTAKEIVNESYRIPVRDIRAGDLLFFNTRGVPYSHVGISLGGGYFIHAPRTGTLVRIDAIEEPYWRRRFEGAMRPIETQSRNSQ